MTEAKQRITTEPEILFDFEIPRQFYNETLVNLPENPHVISVGSGTPPNEPKEIAMFLRRNIKYTGIDNDSESIASGNTLSQNRW